MTPTDFAESVHAKFGLLRGQRDAVREHATALRSTHVFSLPIGMSDAVDDQRQALASSPADLSERLLRLMFGHLYTAQSDSSATTQRPGPGLIVSEVCWDAWNSAVGATDFEGQPPTSA
jgi:acyl-CoA-binding protein